jgi:hypothetical protein
MNKVIRTLLVAHDREDARFLERAHHDHPMPYGTPVEDQVSTTGIREQRRSVERRSLRDLGLLDPDLPISFRQLTLQRTKEHGQWKMIPVVALTTSNSQRSIQAGSARRVDCSNNGPLEFDVFHEMAKQVRTIRLTPLRLTHWS